jgi:hypothetical protein
MKRFTLTVPQKSAEGKLDHADGKAGGQAEPGTMIEGPNGTPQGE